MGITGLLPFLEKASSVCNLRDLRGKCVAIDTYCWLHRGAFGCAERLARGEPTDAHIQFCLKYVQLLLRYNIKPILVFDGRHLPAKAATEAKRRENRENARKRGAELLRLGRIDEARSYMRRCVDITHEMALQLIQECRSRNVDCVVAPYEADAQLAFLNRTDIAQYVITEDSDLVLFGCTRILFKLDLTGNCRLVEANKLYLAMGCKEDRFEFAKFRYMCILSGCDYLDSLPGIGLAKACRFVLKTEGSDVRKALSKMPTYLNMRQLTVSEKYKDDFLKADATFKHMVVYDPVHRRQTRLLDPDEEGTPDEYCCNAGEFLDEPIAFNLALGNLDPFTLRVMDDWNPDCAADVEGTRQHASIWKKNYNALIAEKGTTTAEGRNSAQIKTASVTKFVKRPAVNAEFVAQGTKDTIGDVLQAYGIQSAEPPLKRLCQTQTAQSTAIFSGAIEYEDVNALETLALLDQPTTPKQKRNPFAVATVGGPIESRDSAGALLSPTKITPENRSLLRNVTPVKRIDYSSHQRETVVSSTATNIRLSKFKRANTSDGDGGPNGGAQKVISRFFCSQQTKTQRTSITNVPPATVGHSPDASNNPAGKSATESPTAIVREIKNKRGKSLDATAMYLLSPEAQLLNRGERTPEKGTKPSADTPERPARLGPTDSGLGMERESNPEDNGDTGLSSSQKENDVTGAFPFESESASPKPRVSVRLALFEHQEGRKLNDRNNDTEELAIVLDDEDEDERDNADHQRQSDNHGTVYSSKVSAQGSTLSNISGKASGSNKSGTGGAKNSKTRPSACRRPGLSASRKQGSGGAKSEGLTQSRLSMFGFQKKPSMQLANP